MRYSYIVLTVDGNTESPSGDTFNNMQVLGWTSGSTPKIAADSFLEVHPEIKEAGYTEIQLHVCGDEPNLIMEVK